MSLRIFVSSVSGEFETERSTLEAAIRKLGEIYVGMEYFGSDPRSARTFDDEAVSHSDLYVGLFGDRFGSIEPDSGKSFTELEYAAAGDKGIPILAYFKHGFVTANEEPLQARFKEHVRQARLGTVFQDQHELETQFLIDLFKQIRGPLFSKLRPQLGQIPFDALHAATKSVVPEQIAAIGHDKYIPEIYVPRPAEERIAEFVHFEEHFSARSAEIIRTLERIAQAHPLLRNLAPALLNAREAASHSEDAEGLFKACGVLKELFFFQEVEAKVADLQDLLRTTDGTTAGRLAIPFAEALRGRPYVNTSVLPDLVPTIVEGVRRRVSGGQIEESIASARAVFPSTRIGNRVILANELLKEFDQLNERVAKRCIALVDKAGRGKTNVMCRIAHSTVSEHPVVFLSGQLEFSAQYDLEWHIQRCLESAFGDAFADWIQRSAAALEQSRRWLFVVVDGINESADLSLLARLFQQLLPKLARKRIKLILSCRDIYWDLYLPSLRPYLFEPTVPLAEFSNTEWERAVELYFSKFRIVAQVQGDAATSLRNPLLLRFFCLAYEGRTLGRVSDIHLLSVFNLYMDGVGRNIATRLGLIAADPVLMLLLAVARAMWQERVPELAQSRLGLPLTELASTHSTYTLIRAENVILDESRHAQSTTKFVRFVYDVFMEYILARCWYEDIVGASGNDSMEEILLRQAIESVMTFPSALGAILFLDQMLVARGRLVNRALSLSGSVREQLLHSRQAILIHALEHMDPVNVGDDVLKLVDRFESVLPEDLRGRLANVILRLIEHNPGRKALRPVVERMLEVDSQNKKIAMDDAPTGEQPVRSTLSRILDKWLNRPKRDMDVQPLGPPSPWEGKGLPRLPAVRSHYTEQTKLSAIGLIVGSRDPRDHELIERGIRKLGRMDLHSALHALEHVDLAEDAFVYKTIAGHIGAAVAEYRIYCAWLLRERYGAKPAEYLLRLLSDSDTRVHRYSFSLFETRQVEEELIRGVLADLADSERLRSWILTYRVKLLGMRDAFRPTSLADSYGSSIVAALRRLSGHRLPGLRLVAYRSLSRFPERVDRVALARMMRADPEARLRALTDQTAR